MDDKALVIFAIVIVSIGVLIITGMGAIITPAAEKIILMAFTSLGSLATGMAIGRKMEDKGDRKN